MAYIKSIIVPFSKIISTIKADSRNILGIIEFSIGDNTSDININNDIPYIKVSLPPFHNESFFELWTSQKPITYYRTKNYKYASDGSYMFICNSSDIKIVNTKETTLFLYNRLFKDILNPHKYLPLRVWNYLPQINTKDTKYGDNYKAFCKGRLEAFIKNNIIDNYPAATTVGSLSRNLNVCCLSSNLLNLTYIENPGQTPAYQYPIPEYYSPPVFSRAICHKNKNGRMSIFISGTASIAGHQSIFPDDVRKQCITSLENIKHLISIKNLSKYGINQDFSLKDLDCIKVYIRNNNDFQSVKDLCDNYFSSKHTISYLNTHICRVELLVEIEGVISI